MNLYPSKITKLISYLKNAGKLETANAVATNATFICGCVLKFSLQIEEQKIIEVKFQTNGCGFMMAAAELLAENIKGKTLAQLGGLDDLTQKIKTELNEFPENRQHCFKLSVETLQSAFENFRSVRLEEWSGEKALICTCFGVSEETIEKTISENYCETVEEVSAVCHAGSGCGSCQPLIQEIIDSYDIISN